LDSGQFQSKLLLFPVGGGEVSGEFVAKTYLLLAGSGEGSGQLIDPFLFDGQFCQRDFGSLFCSSVTAMSTAKTAGSRKSRARKTAPSAVASSMVGRAIGTPRRSRWFGTGLYQR